MAVVAMEVERRRVATLAVKERPLPFTLKWVAASNARVGDVAVKVGPWLVSEADVDELPGRAAQRVVQLEESGFPLRQLAIYHEIPKPSFVRTHVTPRMQKASAAFATWATQELPVMLEQAGQWLNRNGPTILGAIAVVLGVVFAAVCALLVVAAGAAAAAVASDPVLIAIDQQGHWWEVDRWYA